MKALEKRPEMRYPTMDEFIRAMADPVGYVEAHGGVGGFLQRQLMPSTAPLPPARLTPAPLDAAPRMTGRTALAGAGHADVTPSPTTLGRGAGQVAGQRSKTGFVIAGGARRRRGGGRRVRGPERRQEGSARTNRQRRRRTSSAWIAAATPRAVTSPSSTVAAVRSSRRQ